MILAIDCDNVLLNLMEQTINMYNAKYNCSLTMSDITSYSFYECMSQGDADKICALFLEKNLWSSLKPIKDSQECIEKLVKAGHTILVTTATHEKNFAWKCDLLRKFYPSINPNNIIRIMDKSYIKADIMIEDDMSQLIKHKSCERICLDYPWNRQREGKDFVYGIFRCSGWNEILDAVNKIVEEMKKYE